MHTLGNILLALAAVIYVVPLQLLAFESPIGKRDEGGSAVWASILVLAPLWLLIAATLAIVTSRGGLDWIGRERWLQIGLAVCAVAGLFVVTAFCYVGKFTPHSFFPVSLRPLTLLLLLVTPLIALGFCAFALNPSLSPALSPKAYRIPFAVVGALGVVVFTGMVGQWLVSGVLRKGAALRYVAAGNDQRDQQILDRLATLDPQRDFAELIGFGNRYEKSNIRELAIRKAKSHPDFDAALDKVLRSGWADQALTYLDACDVPDRKRFADAVNAAIQVRTDWVRDSVERTHTFHASAFDSSTQRILSVVEKFRGQGVDYVPAIRGYRKAMDSERTQNVEFNARKTLDKWLAKHSTLEKP